jgi:hypothetical protein
MTPEVPATEEALVARDAPGDRLPDTGRCRARDWLRDNWHFVILACWAAGWFLGMVPHGGVAWDFFEQGTAALFGEPGKYHPPGGLHLYASNPYLQIGPLAFAVAEILRHLSPDNGIVAAEVILTAAGVCIVAAIEGLARAVRPDLASRPIALRLTVLAGGAAFLVAWVDLAVGYAHLDDGLALVLAVSAARAAAARRPVLAGLCVGLAADAKPWALIFLTVLLLLPARDWWRALTAAAVALAAAWLPFLIADPGTIAAVRYTIGNMPDSALRALGVAGPRTPSWDRPAQILLGWALGAVAVSRGRWPAVILLGVGARIALDPGVHGYYTAGVMVGALIWDTAGSRRPWPLWSLLSLLILTGMAFVKQYPALAGDARLALVVAFTAALLLSPARLTWHMGRGAHRSGRRHHPGESGLPPCPGATASRSPVRAGRRG